MKLGINDISDLKIGVTNINEVRIGSTLVWQRNVPSYTSDFISATGIANATIIAALTALEADLTSAGIIDYNTPANNLVTALYPIVGGTASHHKYNFLNPLDTNAAFRITWAGTITHDADGVLGDGSSGTGNTFLNFNILPQNSNHLMYNIHSGSGGGWYDIGTTGGDGNFYMVTNFNNGGTHYLALSDSEATFSGTGTGPNGVHLARRIDANTLAYDYNGTYSTTRSKSSTSHTGAYLGVLGMRLNGGVLHYSTRKYNFFSFGKGLTDQQAIDYCQAVLAFNTALGR